MRELERRARDMDAHRNIREHELLEADEAAHENAIPSCRPAVLLHHDCH
ncbi:MAG: hypothetical protein K6G91_00015 [Kiritimatiellae bacterium]|nr:hypothetical protein [Kiritimatiellia bacterium]